MANMEVLCRPTATVQALTNQAKKLSTNKQDLIMVLVGLENFKK